MNFDLELSVDVSDYPHPSNVLPCPVCGESPTMVVSGCGDSEDYPPTARTLRAGCLSHGKMMDAIAWQKFAALEAQREARMTEELKPCPFCGDDGRPYLTADRFVRCEECGMRGPTRPTHQQAVESWNELDAPAPSVSTNAFDGSQALDEAVARGLDAFYAEPAGGFLGGNREGKFRRGCEVALRYYIAALDGGKTGEDGR